MIKYSQTSNISCTLVGNKISWSLRWSWSIACRRSSNYIFILDLTPGCNGLGKGSCKIRRETLKFVDLVRHILEVWLYTLLPHFPFLSLYPSRQSAHVLPVPQRTQFSASHSETVEWPGISLTNIRIRVCMSNYIHIKQWGVISHPCPNFNGHCHWR